MIPVGIHLVSDDLAKVRFYCNLPECHGACCVAGDVGAPLDPEEIELIQENLEEILPYMTPKGIETINQGGVFDYDMAGNYVTPLIEDRECVFAFFAGGIARCAIEKAWEAGKSSFRKPVSCHLYPIRITNLGQYDGINYHEWSVCRKALTKGRRENVPLYVFVKEALIRKYGEEWYLQLEQQLKQKTREG